MQGQTTGEAPDQRLDTKRLTLMRVSLDRVTRPRAHGVLVELSWAGARMRPALLTGSRTANRNRVPHILSAETPGLGTSWHPMTGMPIASLGWAARSSLQLVEVEDCAGTARDGASDDGHPSAVSSARARAWMAGRRPPVSARRASMAASSWAPMAWSAPTVTASHHGPASTTRAGERLSGSPATARRACSIDAAGHPLVTTARLMTTDRHRAVHRAVGLPRTRRVAAHR